MAAELALKCYKAHLIAQGFSQWPGLDYHEHEIFAPIMRFAAIRLLLTEKGQEAQARVL